MGQTCHKATVDVAPVKLPNVLMHKSFLEKLAQHQLTSDERFQLGEALGTTASTVEVVWQDEDDYTASSPMSLLTAWRNSAGDVEDATPLYEQLRQAYANIGRGNLEKLVLNALTEERTKIVEAAAKPVLRETDKDKSLRALRVMSLLHDYGQPELWQNVESQFVIDGHLDMSRVLCAANLPHLIYLLTSGMASNVVSLTLIEDPAFSKKPAVQSMGACLASMPQLRTFVMSKHNLNIIALQYILDGISHGCPLLEVLDLSDNNVFYKEEACKLLGIKLLSMPKLRELHMRSCHLTDMSLPHMIEGISEGCTELELFDCRWNHYVRCRSGKIFQNILRQLHNLTIRAYDCGLAVRCANYLTTEFGDRFTLAKNC